MDNITMKINADNLIMMALREDVTSEDITTNSVMPEFKLGTADLICKQDGRKGRFDRDRFPRSRRDGIRAAGRAAL